MTAAGAIFVIAVGAILRYATDINVEGVSLDTVGLILMIAGAAGLLIGLWQFAALRRSRERPAEAPVEERREVREPPRY
jgi:Domain of unknown function (DUF6458)